MLVHDLDIGRAPGSLSNAIGKSLLLSRRGGSEDASYEAGPHGGPYVVHSFAPPWHRRFFLLPTAYCLLPTACCLRYSHSIVAGGLVDTS